MRVEEIVQELLNLARRKPLSKEELSKARELMRQLKEMGFTNREISELTDGGWSEPTVKLYTRGVTVKDPSPKENTIKLLTQLVRAGLTLKDVELAVSMKEDFDAKGIDFTDVSSLLGEAKRLRVDAKELIQMHRGLRDSGLSIAQLSEALSYKHELEAAGFTIEGLKRLSEVSRAYGGYDEILEAINKYDSLEALNAELERVRSEKGKLEKRVGELTADVKRLEERKGQLEGALKLYEKLKRLGFDEATLRELKKSSEKYGGVKKVLEAVNTYADLAELKSKVQELEKKRLEAEAELKRIQAEHAHLQTVIGMCETLLYKYKFSISAITDIYETAKRYGEPIEVLKAIGKYGELKKIEEEVEKLQAEKSELKASVRELNRQIRKARGIVSELNTSIKSTMEVLEKSTERLANKFSEAAGALSSSFRKAQKDISETYANSIAKVVNEVSRASIILGQLEERAKRIESLSVIIDLIEKPQSIKKPVSEVMESGLAFLLGLKNYVDINKDKVKDAHWLKEYIEKLEEQLIKCLRD